MASRGKTISREDVKGVGGGQGLGRRWYQVSRGNRLGRRWQLECSGPRRHSVRMGWRDL